MQGIIKSVHDLVRDISLGFELIN